MVSPTTPSHLTHRNINGYSKLHYQHLVKIELSLLSHALFLLQYWFHVFAITVYLIIRIPILTLNLSSPYTQLFDTSPNYSKLQVFGCLCYLWLRPYFTHKLDFCSKSCVFLSYSVTHKCLSVSRFIISRVLYLVFNPPPCPHGCLIFYFLCYYRAFTIYSVHIATPSITPMWWYGAPPHSHFLSHDSNLTPPTRHDHPTHHITNIPYRDFCFPHTWHPYYPFT